MWQRYKNEGRSIGSNMHLAHRTSDIDGDFYFRKSRYREHCTDCPYKSQGKAWPWPMLQRHRAHIAIRHRGLGRESRALFGGRWLVLEGPSSDNAGAALPTDVSVYTWLSQAGRFIRAVVTSNVERVMMSQVDMNRFCHSIVRENSILPYCPGRRR